MSEASWREAADDPRPRNPLTWLLLGLVRVYQLVVSPWLPPSCKYYPSCSAYAVTALRRHGVLRGGWLATWRLLRCNPWSLGGVDHVPPRQDRSRRMRESPARGRTLRQTVGGAPEGDPPTRGARTRVPQDR